MTWSVDEMVGVASEPLDPWEPLDPLDESDRRAREYELFRRRGIPEELLPWASALRWTFPPDRPLQDSPVELRVGGDAPPRTIAELTVCVEQHRMGLHLRLPDGYDLSRLGVLVPHLTYLTVGSDGKIFGWDVLDHAQQLVQLISCCRKAGAVPTAPLPELRRVLGSRELLALACAAPHLVELQVDLAGKPWPAGLEFEGPLEHLQIDEAARLRLPPSLRDPSTLRILRIFGAQELDLSTFPADADLEWLEVYRTRILRGADRIAQMTRLRTLRLERVKSIPGAEALRRISPPHVNISRSDPAAQRALKR